MQPPLRPCRRLFAGLLAILALARFGGRGAARRDCAGRTREPARLLRPYRQRPRAALAAVARPAIGRLFDVNGPYVLKSNYYRCAGGAVLVCWVGAKLLYGKANTSKTLPAAQWCATHANSDFIPMYVTGHDTLYSRRGAGGKAAAGAPVGKLDARGSSRIIGRSRKS